MMLFMISLYAHKLFAEYKQSNAQYCGLVISTPIITLVLYALDSVIFSMLTIP